MKNNFSRLLGERLLKILDVYLATGISKSTLTKFYYQRTTNIQLETLVRICDFFQVSLSELIEYVPKKDD